MENQVSYAVILPAGGLGKRMGGSTPKQLLPLGNKLVYQYSLETFLSFDEISEIVLAVPADWFSFFQEELRTKYNNNKKIKIILGGSERYLSVKNGLFALTTNPEFILVHDTARPFISEEIILRLFKTLKEKGSCIVAKPCTDTVKIATTETVEKTIDRNTVWLAQTPQCTKTELLKNLYQKLEKENTDFLPTDEASILEHFNEPVFIVQGNILNDKLTTPEDFKLAEEKLKLKF